MKVRLDLRVDENLGTVSFAMEAAQPSAVNALFWGWARAIRR
jgi:hypothetical protein